VTEQTELAVSGSPGVRVPRGTVSLVQLREMVSAMVVETLVPVCPTIAPSPLTE